MNEILKETLRENETVRWESKAKDFSVLGGKYGKKFIMRVVVAALIAAGIIAGHISSGSEPKTGLIVLIVAVVLAVAVTPFLEKGRLMKARYWITDQRVIIIGSDKLARSMEISYIDAIKVTADEGAKYCLVLGSCVFGDAEKSMRWRAGNPKMPEEAGSRKDCALGMILYNAEKAEEAVAMLKELGCAKAA